ncbi:SusC/RagA family TonB-linked outer membrane protein [Arcticibacter eurypsychrophilus]|uniref:SusC/RagA family TonB-linked outer membrane protein n=1 Tax=Arcticibacter eurypsychrophilus TaxID=1434752 RepID=UPI00084D4FBC|nr:TonB-dependent receptor [Arcticibacter eurypsychrophilus]
MHPFTNQIRSCTIIITALLFFISGNVFSQVSSVVRGKVTDQAGVDLPGVSIRVKGNNTGTSTDTQGQYTISVPTGDATLVFVYIGFSTQELQVNNRSTINVSMTEESRALSEVVVVGYGTTNRRDVTGSITSVKTDDLPQVANASIDNLLQGRAPGLNLTSRSAQPGGGLDINIRGSISPRGSNSPLYVIDGVPILTNSSPERSVNQGNLGYYGGVDRSPLSSINPGDIESIDVLKDASATAIYGSAAANGVILITTKKGKAGLTTTDYRGSFTIQTPDSYFDLLNATEFMQQNNRLSYDKYLYDNNLAPYGNANSSAMPAFTPKFTDSQISGAGEGTDWLDRIMRKGYIQEHNISVSGGSEKTKVFTSFNYFDNKAILKNSDFKRLTGRVNLEQQISNRVKANINLSISQVNNNNASTGSNNGGVEAYNMLQTAYAFSPTVGVYDENGDYSSTFDPLITNPEAFSIIKDKTKTKRVFIAPNIEAKLLKNLKANVVVGIDDQSSQRNFFLPAAVGRANLPNGMAFLSTSNIGNYSGEGYFTYANTFGKSNLSVVAGAGYYKTITDGFGLEAIDFFTDAFEDNNVGAASNKERSNVNSDRTEFTKISQFVRINYSLADKYIFTFTGRNDGASSFAYNKKYGFFPGISGAWRLKNENFLKDVSMLSDLKIRAGYGTSGNEIRGNYALALYTTGSPFVIGQTQYTGVAQSQVDNADLTWETDATINLGLDFGFFNNRLSGSFDIFRKTAKDLLDVIPLPSNNTVGYMYANVGSTRSDGVELGLNSINFSGDFGWTTSFNISTYKNYWVERNPVTPLASYIGDEDRIREIYGWETDGIIKRADQIPAYMPDAKVGNIIYKDINNDGTLDINDVVKLGTSDPKLNIGLGNTFTFKGFDLNFFFYGILGNKIFNNYSGYYDTRGLFLDPYRLAVQNPSNTITEAKNIWSFTNPEGSLPGIANNPYTGSNPSGNNDFYLENGSFIRLKNITMGYTFSNKTLNSSKTFKAIRVFADVQNVGVITKYKGYDPEFGTRANPYPMALSTTFGLNVTF